MNLMNKLMEKRKLDNKGFSLVELIIVIAIMAILVGIVGTQVLPYLERSKESKDLQIVNSYSTAAMTAYSSNADKVTIPAPASGDATIEVKVYTSTTGDAGFLAGKIKALTYGSLPSGKMGSKEGKKIADVVVEYNFTKKTITTKAVDSSGNQILDTVTADL